MKMVIKTPRIPIPPAVKEYIFERNNYKCRSCGKTNRQTTLNIDHIIPLAKGGSNDMSNLQTLCEDCNRRKKDYWDPRFKRYYS